MVDLPGEARSRIVGRSRQVSNLQPAWKSAAPSHLNRTGQYLTLVPLRDPRCNGGPLVASQFPCWALFFFFFPVPRCTVYSCILLQPSPGGRGGLSKCAGRFDDFCARKSSRGPCRSGYCESAIDNCTAGPTFSFRLARVSERSLLAAAGVVRASQWRRAI
ncbi:hypothetical protein N658DRAFT_351083 [Parathielavia hyrcaniae]|uniref:Uncharacterized protein n=1 Tax=Parathielavia hyrcaniae TaxID=113614 RepID=A0AAN6Q7D4_9PEZI|nr:hypothetical protein N658DRAFT_351083 [Parathielavia hyrcaniae]